MAEKLQVSKKTAGRIGLFGAISVIVGAVVGIGIFFKNGGIFKNNNGNATGVLLSWAIAILIGLATAYAYGEISASNRKNTNSGLGGWSNNFVGHGFGRCVKLWQPFLYYSFYVVCTSVFSAEAIFNCVASGPDGINTNIKMWMVMLVAVGVMIFFTTSALLSSNLNKNFSKITTPIKSLPLAAAIVLGLVFGIMHGQHNLFNNSGQIFNPPTNKADSGVFSINGVFMSLPPILFALDSFLIVGNIASDVKNPQRNLPLSIFISMILSGSLYLLVTLGQLFVGCGSVYQVISFIFTGGTDAGSSLGYHVCYTIISVFILISILGVTNSLSMAVVFSAQAILDEEILAGSKKFKKWGNGRKNLAGYIVVWLFAGTMLLVYGIPSIILNTDQIMDGLSNLPVLAFFTIYGIVAIGSAINRFTHRVKVYPIPLQSPIAIIGGVGCIVIALYAIIYTFCVDSILHATSTDTGWGLFLHNGWGNEQFALNKWQAAAIFWSFGLIFIILPPVNDWLIKKTNPHYNQPFFWQHFKK